MSEIIVSFMVGGVLGAAFMAIMANSGQHSREEEHAEEVEQIRVAYRKVFVAYHEVLAERDAIKREHANCRKRATKNLANQKRKTGTTIGGEA